MSSVVDSMEFMMTIALLEVFEARFLMQLQKPIVNNIQYFNHIFNELKKQTCSRSHHSDRRKRKSFIEGHRKQILTALRFTVAGVQQELGFYPDIVTAMGRSLRNIPFRTVQDQREEWQLQRRQLQNMLPLVNADPQKRNSTAFTPQIHFVTFASDRRPGLENLLLSAQLAGIHIEVFML